MNEALAALPFGAMLGAAEAEQLLAVSKIEPREPGPLLPDSSRTDDFWFLIDGRWIVRRRVAGVDQIMFEADRPGSWTGGVPLIDSIAPVSPEVLAPSRFLRVPIEAMQQLAGDNPKVARWLLEGLEWGAGHIGGLLAGRSEQPS